MPETERLEAPLPRAALDRIPVEPLLDDIVCQTRGALGAHVACVVLHAASTTWARGCARGWQRAIGATLLAAAQAVGGVGRITLCVGVDRTRGVIAIAVTAIGSDGAGTQRRRWPPRSLATACADAGLRVSHWHSEPRRFSSVLNARWAPWHAPPTSAV